MFSGLVEELGTVRERHDTSRGATLVIAAEIVVDDVKLGDSISVNGCCLTVTDFGPGWWRTDAVPETLSRTNIADLQPGDRVNLERSVRLNDRMGGHLVQGHVDAVGTVLAPAPDLHISVPQQLRRYVVEKGSITIDGISLTVVVPTDQGLTCAIIPHTMEMTTLHLRDIGDRVNLEVDVMAKYAERLLVDAGVLPKET